MTYDPATIGEMANGAEARTVVSWFKHDLVEDVVRGTFPKSTSPETTAKFVAVLARPAGGGGLRRRYVCWHGSDFH